MSLKTDGESWVVREQIIYDASGLTIQFEKVPGGEYRLWLYGDILPLGNRGIAFSADGLFVGSGSHTGPCRPAWITPVDP